MGAALSSNADEIIITLLNQGDERSTDKRPTTPIVARTDKTDCYRVHVHW